MNIIITGRSCNRCKQFKNKEDFYPAPGYKNGLSSLCRLCEKDRRQERFIKDPERKRLLSRRSSSKRRKEIPEYFREKDKKYRQEHPLSEEQKESRRKYYKKWWNEHKEEQHKKQSCRYYSNSEPYKDRAKRYREKNLDIVREKERIRSRTRKIDHFKVVEYLENRRAKKRAVGGRVTKQEWIDLLYKYGNKCLCCGRTDIPLEQDHVIPLNPGKHSIDNLQPLCRSCNARKSRKVIDYR